MQIANIVVAICVLCILQVASSFTIVKPSFQLGKSAHSFSYSLQARRATDFVPRSLKESTSIRSKEDDNDSNAIEGDERKVGLPTKGQTSYGKIVNEFATKYPTAYKAIQLLWFALVVGVACFPNAFGFLGFKNLLSAPPF